ncbi:hypothetical protein HDU96_006710 [Phlyctochytrium bullatum]|nr:hypothetical protein HDU96_006710 [Phlyctochytrium bullatum]
MTVADQTATPVVVEESSRSSSATLDPVPAATPVESPNTDSKADLAAAASSDAKIAKEKEAAKDKDDVIASASGDAVVSDSVDVEAAPKFNEFGQELNEEGFPKYTAAVLVPLFVGLVAAHFLAALDATIVSTALLAISTEFNAADKIAWVATSYVLTFNAFQPLVGKFSQIFGHRIMTLIGIIIFVAGSAWCGLARSIESLIVARAVQGIGGAALLSMVLISISDMFSLKDRPKYLTVLWINFGVSTIIGPLLGGAFTDHISWRWCFLINIPVGVLAFPLVLFFLRIPFKPVPFREQIRRIDFGGVVFLLIAVILILIPTSLGGQQFPWNSPIVIGCFIGAAVAIGILVFIELRATEPIIPPHLFKIRNVLFVFINNFFLGMGFFAFVFYGPQYFQLLHGDSATTAGLQLLPLLLGLVVFSIVGTILLPVVKAYPPFIITGCLLVGAGTFWFSTLDQFSPRGAQIGALLIVGIGLGLVIQMNILAAQASVTQEDTATVSAMASFFQSIGGGIGLAILSAIFVDKQKTGIANVIAGLPAEIRNAFGNSIGGSTETFDREAFNQLPPEIRDAFTAVFAAGLQAVFKYAVPFAAVAFVAALFISWRTKILSAEEMKKAGPSH